MMKKAVIVLLAFFALSCALAGCNDTEQTSGELSAESVADTSSAETSVGEASVAESSADTSSEPAQEPSLDVDALAKLDYKAVVADSNTVDFLDSAAVFAASYGDKYALYFDDWDQYAVLDTEIACASLAGDTAWAFAYVQAEDSSLYKVKMYRFSKNSSEPEEKVLDLPAVQKQTLFYSAVSETVGYLAVFSWERGFETIVEPAYLMLTTDGGKSWKNTMGDFDTPWECQPLMVHFVSKDVGMLSYAHPNNTFDSDLDNRTYATKDGGRTWIRLEQLDLIKHDTNGDVIAFAEQDGTYTISVRLCYGKNEIFDYTSTDLLRWEPAFELDTFDPSALTYVPLGNAFDGTADSDNLTAYFATAEDKTYVYFPERDAYLTIPQKAERLCGASIILDDVFFTFAEGSSDTIMQYSFEQQQQKLVWQSEIKLPESCEDAYLSFHYSGHSGGEDGSHLCVYAKENGVYTLKYLFRTDYHGRALKETVEMSTVPYAHDANDVPVLTRFFDDQEGVAVFACGDGTDLGAHLYATKDGGRNWSQMTDLDRAELTGGHNDLSVVGIKMSSYRNRVYTLTLRDGKTGREVNLISADLQTFAPEHAELPAEYIDGSTNALHMIWGDYNGETVVCMPYWGQTFRFPAGSLVSYHMCGDTALITAWDADTEKNCTVYRLIKGQDTPKCTVLDVPPHASGQEYYYLSNMYFDLVDENIAFLAVMGTENMDEEMLALFRTTDGGNTWQNMREGAAPVSWNWKEFVQTIRFFDERVGLLSRRYSVTDDLHERTLVTFDGGRTWQSPEEFVFDLPYSYADITDCGVKDGVYWVDVAFTQCDDPYQRYESTDLIHWTLAE